MPAARADLDDAVAYLAVRSPASAEALLRRAVRAAESLQTLSERGRIVPDMNAPSVREIIVRPYRLVYRVRPERIEIMGLIHGARDFRAWWQEAGRQR